MVVADASVLIVLAKMRRLQLLRQVHESVAIGPVVKVEVVDRGKAIFALGVEQVERAVQDGWIRVVRLTSQERSLMRRFLTTSRLHKGEAESLALAHRRTLNLLVDDKEGRLLADTIGVRYCGTAGLLLDALLNGYLTFEGLEQAVSELSNVMWLSPAVVTEILKAAREAKK